MKRAVLRILRRPSAADARIPKEMLTSRVYPADAAQNRKVSAPRAGSFALSCRVDAWQLVHASRRNRTAQVALPHLSAVDDRQWADDVTDRLAHLDALLIEDETVCDDILEWRYAIDCHAGQKG